MEEFVLVLALLTTESSYKMNIEQPATKVHDTAQFWFGSSTAWRIRTYGIDHDIHIYSLGSQVDESSLNVGDAEAHIRKHYGEVLNNLYILRFRDPKNSEQVSEVLAAYKLTGSLEVSPAGFAFYNPDRVKYKTQSQPKN